MQHRQNGFIDACTRFLFRFKYFSSCFDFVISVYISVLLSLFLFGSNFSVFPLSRWSNNSKTACSVNSMTDKNTVTRETNTKIVWEEIGKKNIQKNLCRSHRLTAAFHLLLFSFFLHCTSAKPIEINLMASGRMPRHCSLYDRKCRHQNVFIVCLWTRNEFVLAL